MRVVDTISEERYWVIYTLVDSREPEKIRYVGKTVDPTSRLWGHTHPHKHSEKCYSARWIKSVLKDGGQIVMTKIKADRLSKKNQEAESACE